MEKPKKLADVLPEMADVREYGIVEEHTFEPVIAPETHSRTAIGLELIKAGFEDAGLFLIRGRK